MRDEFFDKVIDGLASGDHTPEEARKLLKDHYRFRVGDHVRMLKGSYYKSLANKIGRVTKISNNYLIQASFDDGQQYRCEAWELELVNGLDRVLEEL